MPEPDDSREVSQILARLREGDARAAEELLPVFYGELHRVAGRLMADQRRGHTLQTTDLLNEAWARIAGAGSEYEGGEHFLRVAARAMRSVLVDHARRRSAQKRRRDLVRPLEQDPVATLQEDPHELLVLEEQLERLGEIDAELLRIVELRFFAGLTLEETGAVLGLSLQQVHRRWTMARGWLRTQLASEPRGPGDE